jgi:hypothetical protein
MIKLLGVGASAIVVSAASSLIYRNQPNLQVLRGNLDTLEVAACLSVLLPVVVILAIIAKIAVARIANAFRR